MRRGCLRSVGPVQPLAVRRMQRLQPIPDLSHNLDERPQRLLPVRVARAIDQHLIFLDLDVALADIDFELIQGSGQPSVSVRFLQQNLGNNHALSSILLAIKPLEKVGDVVLNYETLKRVFIGDHTKHSRWTKVPAEGRL